MFFAAAILASQTAAQLSTGVAALWTFVLMCGLVVDAFLIFNILASVFGSAPKLFTAQIEKVPWSALEALFVFFAAILITGSFGGIMYWTAQFLGYARDHAEQVMMLTGNSAKPIIEIILVAVLLKLRRAKFSELFGPRPQFSPGAVGVGLMMFVAVVPPVLLIGAIYQKLIPIFQLPAEPQHTITMLRTEADPSLLVWLMLFAVIIAPLFEEIVFRGFIYPAVKQQLGLTAAVILVSLGFAAIHLNVASFAPLFLLGICLTLAYEATGSLWTPIILHACFNSFFTFMTLQLR
jgi:membrane protease YdiL (CAAX protease family)